MTKARMQEMVQEIVQEMEIAGDDLKRLIFGN